MNEQVENQHCTLWLILQEVWMFSGLFSHIFLAYCTCPRSNYSLYENTFLALCAFFHHFSFSTWSKSSVIYRLGLQYSLSSFWRNIPVFESYVAIPCTWDNNLKTAPKPSRLHIPYWTPVSLCVRHHLKEFPNLQETIQVCLWAGCIFTKLP